MAVIGWLTKNLGLIIGIVEIVLKAIAEILAQLVKVAAGVTNVWAGANRAKDGLVNAAAKLEGISVWIGNIFTAIKGWLYKFGGSV
jgi:hypothetical protein